MKCKKCGEETGGWEVCPKCGAPAEEMPKASKLRSGLIVFASLLCIAVVLALLDITGIVKVFSSASDTGYSEQEFRAVAGGKYLSVADENDGSDVEMVIHGEPGDAEWNISFDSSMTQDQVKSAISAQDADEKAVFLSFSFDGSGAAISLPEENIVPGMPYTITLGEGVCFVKEELKNARTIIFVPERKDTQDIEYQDNVIKLNEGDGQVTGGNTLTLSGSTQVKEGDILILPSKNENGVTIQNAYKAESVSGNQVSTSEPTLEEVFKKLDISGTYQMNPGGFVLDEQAAELQVRQSSFLDCLVRTAYADSVSVDDSKIGISIERLPDSDGMVNIRIGIKMKDALGENADLDFTIDIGYKAEVNLDVEGASALDVSCDSATVIHFGISPSVQVGGISASSYAQFDANDFLNALSDKLKNSGENTITLGSIPFAGNGIVNVSVELGAYFDLSDTGEFDLQSGIEYYNKSGAVITRKYVKPYYTDSSDFKIDSVAGIARIDIKEGLSASLVASILNLADVKLEFDAGGYSEAAGAFSFYGGSYDNFMDRCFGYAESGLYCDLSLKAEINWLVPVKAEEPIFSKNWPQFEKGDKEHISALRAEQSTVNIDDGGKAVLPEFYATYYNVFDGTSEEKQIAYSDLIYGCSDGVGCAVDSSGNAQFSGNLPSQFEMTVYNNESAKDTAEITIINPYFTVNAPVSEQPVTVTTASVTPDTETPEPVTTEPQPAEGPSNVAKKFFKAMVNGDTDTAISCMTSEAAQKSQSTLEWYKNLMSSIQSLNDQLSNLTGYKIPSPEFTFTASNENINSDTATVDISMKISTDGYSYTYPYIYKVSLKIENGEWKIDDAVPYYQ